MANATALMTPVSGDIAMAQAKMVKATPKNGEIEKSAKDFEAMYMSEMFSHMFEEQSPDPVFGGGKGEEMFRGMLVNEYAKKMSQGKGIGISDMVQKAMLAIQEHNGGIK